MALPPLSTLWASSPGKTFRGFLHAFDPGETTGYVRVHASNDGLDFQKAEQLPTWPINYGVGELTHVLRSVALRDSTVVFEAYRIYNWRTDQHANSEVPTLQLIGCLKTLCHQHGLPYYQQTAQQAKEWVTDDKLEAWNLYLPGERHNRDATRHAIFFLLFGPNANTSPTSTQRGQK